MQLFFTLSSTIAASAALLLFALDMVSTAAFYQDFNVVNVWDVFLMQSDNKKAAPF